MKLTLCGSNRFEEQFHEWAMKLSLEGHVVYSLAVFPSYMGGKKDWYTPDQKRLMDLVHLAKIDESDGIVMLNVGGYYGESSTKELLWARMRNKIIYWLEQPSRLTDYSVHHLITPDPPKEEGRGGTDEA